MKPLNIAREIAQVRGKFGDNYLAMALERIQEHINQIPVVAAPIVPTVATAPPTPPVTVPPLGVPSQGLTFIPPPSPFVNPTIGGVNAQTGTTYTIAATDLGVLVTFSNAASIAVTLPDAKSLSPTFLCFLENLGAGVVTITPAVGTIDGIASLTLIKNMGLLVFSDGTNWWTDRGDPAAGGVNAQTVTAYTVVATDNAKLVTLNNTLAVAVTLPTASTMPPNFFCSLENLGTGAVTITPATGTIDGLASLQLVQYQGVIVYSDNTNWFTVRGIPTSVVAGGVNTQTGNYTVQASDNSKLIVVNSAASATVTLPTANTLPPKFYCVIESIGVGLVTVAPATGTIDGALTIKLGGFTGIWVFADSVGNVWYAETGVRLSGVNPQTANYTTVSSDEGKLLTFNSATAVTLTATGPAAGYTNYFFSVENRGAGALTITPAAAATIDGAANLVLNQNQGVQVFFDGTNWFTMRGIPGGGGGGGGSGQVFPDVVSASPTSFDDEFNGSNWDPKWTVVTDTWPAAQKSFNGIWPSCVRLAHFSTGTYDVLLSQAVIVGAADEFSIAAKLFNSGQASETDALLYFSDATGNNQVRCGIKQTGGLGTNTVEINYAHRQAGAWNFDVANLNIPAGISSAYIILQRVINGALNVFECWYSFNGYTFIPLTVNQTETNLSGTQITKIQMELFAQGNNRCQMGVDWFRWNWLIIRL